MLRLHTVLKAERADERFRAVWIDLTRRSKVEQRLHLCWLLFIKREPNQILCSGTKFFRCEELKTDAAQLALPALNRAVMPIFESHFEPAVQGQDLPIAGQCVGSLQETPD